jgi:hypothetical protein
MKVNLNIINISLVLIFLGVFFLPFNSWEGISILGEYHRDASVLFFLTAFIFLLFKKKISLPLHSPIFYLLIIFLIWGIVSTLFNINNAWEYLFKQTSGTERFIRQYISLLIAAFILPITFYNIFISSDLKNVWKQIRTAMLYSLFVVTSYAFFEILIVKFDMFFFKKPILNLFDYLPFVESSPDLRLRRISSISFESPALGTYLITIFSWMSSYAITSKSRYKFLPVLVVISLALVSGSRAATFIVLVQAFVFVLVISQLREYKNIFSKVLISLFIISSISAFLFAPKIISYVKTEIQSFKLNDSDHAMSNKSRFGIQYAMYKVFLENPIIGTGYGLQAFESRFKYPSWAKRDNWEFRVIYLNQNDKSFPPGFNLYLRLASEIGLIGIGIFLVFITYIISWSYRSMSNPNSVLGIIIFISMIGFLLNWLKMDTFRIYGFWICLSLIFSITKLKQNNAK